MTTQTFINKTKILKRPILNNTRIQNINEPSDHLWEFKQNFSLYSATQFIHLFSLTTGGRHNHTLLGDSGQTVAWVVSAADGYFNTDYQRTTGRKQSRLLTFKLTGGLCQRRGLVGASSRRSSSRSNV